MKKLEWTHVTLIVAVMAVLGGLSYAGKDPTPVLAGVITILGTMGFGLLINKQNETTATLATVKEQTNGNVGQLMAMVEQQRQDQIASNERHRSDMVAMADKLATMTPPAPEVPALFSGGETYPSTESAHSSNL